MAQVDQDEHRRVRAVHLGRGVETRHLDHGELGDEFGESLVGSHDEHVSGEHAVPRVFRDDPYRHPVLGVGPGVAVLDEDPPALDVGGHPAVNRFEILSRELPVDVAPPDLVLAARLADHELVASRSTGVVSRANDQGASGQHGFVGPNGVLVEGGSRVVPAHDIRRPDSVILDSVAADVRPDLLHACTPSLSGEPLDLPVVRRSVPTGPGRIDCPPRSMEEMNIRPRAVSLNPGWQRPRSRGKLPRWISPLNRARSRLEP